MKITTGQQEAVSQSETFAEQLAITLSKINICPQKTVTLGLKLGKGR